MRKLAFWLQSQLIVKTLQACVLGHQKSLLKEVKKDGHTGLSQRVPMLLITLFFIRVTLKNMFSENFHFINYRQATHTYTYTHKSKYVYVYTYVYVYIHICTCESIG